MTNHYEEAKKSVILNVILTSDLENIDTYNDIIVTDAAVSFTKLSKYIQAVYDANKGRKISLVDFNNKRIEEFKNIFHFDIFDPDRS